MNDGQQYKGTYSTPLIGSESVRLVEDEKEITSHLSLGYMKSMFEKWGCTDNQLIDSVLQGVTWGADMPLMTILFG